MRAKSASSGKSAPIFIAWPQKVGKRSSTNPKIVPATSGETRTVKFPMPGPSCANKVGHSLLQKSLWKLTVCFAQMPGTMSVVAIIGDPQSELAKIINWAKQQERGAASGNVWHLLYLHLPDLLWCRYNTQNRSLCGTRITSKSEFCGRGGVMCLKAFVRHQVNPGVDLRNRLNYTS